MLLQNPPSPSEIAGFLLHGLEKYASNTNPAPLPKSGRIALEMPQALLFKGMGEGMISWLETDTLKTKRKGFGLRAHASV